MHLKRLQLIGFKTFADRTLVEFSPGVTAIVGPNGSGKSNIADAILWVLGEQRASAVRGTKLQDVIFSGSALRKPTGLAEVSLTVDNSDGSLPLSFDEITVTRRAYRNGEGEFFINKTPCRLKDIQELFLDTGVGRESYALVNQSEIDAVLSADPQARRPLFEEAAGIHKFRVKKREALRKLEQTESNLVRVRDIVREIERALGPIERQAEEAMRYLAVKERLESLERNYLVAELRESEASLDKVRSERSAAVATAESRLAEMRAAEASLASTASALAAADSDLEAARSAHQSALSQLERVRSERELAAQRAQGLLAQTEMIRAEIEDLESRQAASSRTLESAGCEAAEAKDRDTRLQARVEMLDAQRSELAPRIADLRRAEEGRLRRIAERERAKSERDAELSAMQARVDQYAARERELTDSSAHAEAELAVAQAEQTRVDESKERAGSAMREADESADASERRVQSERDALASAQSVATDLQAKIATVRSRLQTLQELEAAHDGYYAGVRAVLRAAESGRLSGSFLVVADAFSAPEGYDLAFEAALGGSVQDVIVETEREAKDAIEMLKQDRAGRATFLPLNRIRPYGSRPDTPGDRRGFLGCAADLVSFDARNAAVIEMLLGRTLICETVDDALALAERSRGWGKIVTLAGEMLLPSGAIAGGSSGRNLGALLHRKAEIAALIEASEQADAQAHSANGVVDVARAQIEEALAAAAALAAKRTRCRETLNEADRAQDRSARDMERLEREMASGRSQLAAIGSERLSAQHVLSERRAAMAASPQTADGDLDDGGQTGAGVLQELIDRERAVHEEWTQARVDLAAVQQKLRGEANLVQGARLDIERIAMQKAGRDGRLEALMQEMSGLNERSGSLAADEARFESDLAGRLLHLESRQALRAGLASEAGRVQSQVSSLAEQRGEAQSAAQSAELREARLQMQQSQAAARLLEEYDVTVADALSLDESPMVAPETPREVARLRREMRGFGDVNAHAAVEFAQLKSRHATMFEQQQDAEAAKDKVLTAIREIDDSTRGLFMTSFHQVVDAFEALFRRLMGGGRTELTLTDPDNLLETGIDIAVQAPGKKKQNLLLLSGGERALTATALLFAFLQVRPAPFSVLDEVDASLDGVNVERFANLLRDFGRSGQYLVITHNPSTMEAARRWYGVTMQEPGVSRVLSMEAPAQADLTGATMEPMALNREELVAGQ